MHAMALFSFWFHIASLSCKEADEILNTEALQFDLASIRTATNNFSEANKLGRGGFGTVYRVMNHITKDVS